VVVAQARELADQTGFSQLTLAAVAQRLGVALPSLYKHVRGLEDLQRQISALALRELADAVTRATAGRSRTTALRALAAAYWDYAHVHPGSYAATLRAPSSDDQESAAAAGQLLDVVYAVLEGYGIEGDDAVDATRTLRALLHGYVALEAAGGFGIARDVRESFDRAIEAFDATLTAWR
jgi:AcrR family transcriptional regulator